MKRFLTLFLLLASIALHSQTNVNYLKVSEKLINNLKQKKSVAEQVAILEKSKLNDLVNQLKTDQQKLAFWVNVYNGFIQVSLSENPKLYEDRSAFFAEPRIKIAGETLSFADVEHGIIRKSKVEWGLGYIRKWFPPKWQRELRVDEVDWRIHFALNCGAKSCPPVAVYTAENLDKEFDFMTTKYLNEQTTYDKSTKTAKSVSLFSWFRGDFGGLCGAKKILQEYKIAPEEPKELEFSDYDWTLLLNNYREIPN